MDDLDGPQARLADTIARLVYDGAAPPARDLSALAGHTRTLAAAPYRPDWGEVEFRPAWLVDLARRGHRDWHTDWCRAVSADPGRVDRIDRCCRDAADHLEAALAARGPERTDRLEAALVRLSAGHRQLPDPRYRYDTPLGFHPEDVAALVRAAAAVYRAWSDGAGRPPGPERDLLAEAWRRLRAQDPLSALALVDDTPAWVGEWSTPLASTQCVV